MIRPNKPLLACVGAVLLLTMPAGCLTKKFPNKERFVLEAARSGAPQLELAGVLRIERVRISELFERKGFVYRSEDARYEEDFYREFFVPPARLLQRATREWLTQSGLFASVIEPDDRSEADLVLQVNVVDLYADARDMERPQAVMRIEYTLLRSAHPRPTVVARKTYSATETIRADEARALVAAWERGLSRILADFEADLSAALARKAAAVR